jgi:hypothetical protein
MNKGNMRILLGLILFNMSSPVPLSSSSYSTHLFSLYIINKAGGLIYQKDFCSTIPKLNANDYLRLASTFHSLHAITARGIKIKPTNQQNSGNPASSTTPHFTTPLDPSHPSGITSLLTADFRLQCHQTATGLKFLIIASPSQTAGTLQATLLKIYALYCDYVLKNPFYEVEMPIRVELFDSKLLALIQGT